MSSYFFKKISLVPPPSTDQISNSPITPDNGNNGPIFSDNESNGPISLYNGNSPSGVGGAVVNSV